MDWFATWSAGILRGSLSEAPDSIQLIWLKLMAMANEAKDPLSGRLEFAKGKPYSLDYIATICLKPIGELETALEEFQKDISKDGTPRITIEPDGTVVLNNWARHQPKQRGQTKQSGNGEKPKSVVEQSKTIWDAEHRENIEKAMVFKGAQKHPKSAKAGIEVAETEKRMKEASHQWK
jgi:hypothetical protein